MACDGLVFPYEEMRELTDHMKGYVKRTRRRRASYKKTNSLFQESYHNKSKWIGMGTSSRKRKQKLIFGYVGAGVLVLAVLGVAAFVLQKNVFHPNGTESAGNTVSQAAAGASQAAAQVTEEENSDAVTQAVIAVDSLKEDAISKPAPKKRSKAVALTFDDGPSTENSPKILSLLEKYNAHATFFVVGNRVKSGRDILKKEIEIGCEIGNHSWDHANLSKMRKIAQVNRNLNKTVKLVKKLTGYDIKLTRPPYGAISDVMRKKMKSPMILWSVDTLDWKSKNAKAVMKQLKRQVKDGAIILVHDIHASTAEAMEEMLPWLIKNDYDILTVTELMQRKGIKMKNGVAYGSGA